MTDTPGTGKTKAEIAAEAVRALGIDPASVGIITTPPAHSKSVTAATAEQTGHHLQPRPEATQGGPEATQGTITAEGGTHSSSSCVSTATKSNGNEPDGTPKVHWNPAIAMDATPGGNTNTLPSSLMELAVANSRHLSPESKMEMAMECVELNEVAKTDLTKFKGLLMRPTLQDGQLRPGNVAFVVIRSGDETLSVVHSMAQCVLPKAVAGSGVDGKWIGFVGDHITVPTVGGAVLIQDPPAVVMEFTEAVVEWQTIKAVPKTIMEDDEKTKKTTYVAPTNGKLVEVPTMLAVPWFWVAFLLEEPRTAVQFWRYVMDETKTWTTEPSKTIRASYLMWLQAMAAAQPDTDSTEKVPVNCSAGELNLRMVPLPDPGFAVWAATRLNELFPRPAPMAQLPPPPTNQALLPVLADAMVRVFDSFGNTQEAAARRAEAAAMPKKKELDETTLCLLLGWANLSLSEAKHLPEIWTILLNSSTKAQKHAALRVIFQRLAKKNSLFYQFDNRKVFDHIIEMTLAPGLTEDTIHHGLSPLAFVPMTAQAIQQQAAEYHAMDNASVITTADITRVSAKGPPPNPTNFIENQLLIEAVALILEELFTTRCDYFRKINSFRVWGDKNQNQVMGDSRILKHLLPQSLWTIIKDGHQYFNTFTSKEDLMRDPPKFPESQHSYTYVQLSNMQSINLMGMPACLLKPFDDKAPKRQKRQGDELDKEPKRPGIGGGLGGGRSRGSGRQLGDEPVENMDQHPVFANDAEWQRLLAKKPTISMNEVAQAAGYKRFGDVPRGDFPRDQCGNWHCKRICYKGCYLTERGKQGHGPGSALSEAGCKALLASLRPGIQKLLADA